MKIGLVTPYIYPLPGGVNAHVRHLYENLVDARPRRAHHQQHPRPAEVQRGRHHPPRLRLQRAHQRLGRHPHRLAALPGPGARPDRRPSASTCSTSTSRSCRSCRPSAARLASVNVATFHAYAGWSPAYEFSASGCSRGSRRAPARPDRGQRGGPPLHRPLLPGRLQGHPQRRRPVALRVRPPHRALARRHAEHPVRRPLRDPQGPARTCSRRTAPLRRAGRACRLLVVGSGPQEREVRRYIADAAPPGASSCSAG